MAIAVAISAALVYIWLRAEPQHLSELRLRASNAPSADSHWQLALALARAGSADAGRHFAAAARLPPLSLTRLAASLQTHSQALLGGRSRIPIRSESVAAADAGGWAGRPAAAIGRGDGRCDIDSRAQLSAAEFEAEYVRAGKPVLLPLSAVRPEDAPPLNWTRGALLAAHGDVEVEVLSKSTQVTADQFGGGGTRLQRRDTLRGFVEAHLDSGGAVEALDDPPYIFSQRALPALSIELGGLATSPAFLQPTDHKRIVSLGPTHAGSAWHDHSHSFFALVHGEKRWLLLPPGASAGAAGSSAAPLQWLSQRQPGGATPLTCTQQSGQALFVPSGWLHAVLNLRDSVGVAVEVGDVAMMELASSV